MYYSIQVYAYNIEPYNIYIIKYINPEKTRDDR